MSILGDDLLDFVLEEMPHGAGQGNGVGLPVITMTALAGAYDTTDATSFATGSVTPSAGKLVLLAVNNVVGSGTANEPTATGNRLTYVKIATVLQGTNLRRLTLFRAMGVSPSAGAITIDCGGQTTTGCAHSVAEFGNVLKTGANGSGAIGQSATANNTGTSLTAILGAFRKPRNATYGVHVHGANEASTVGTGFTAIHDVAGAAPVVGFQSEWRVTPDQTVDASWATSSAALGIAVEIRAK